MITLHTTLINTPNLVQYMVLDAEEVKCRVPSCVEPEVEGCLVGGTGLSPEMLKSLGELLCYALGVPSQATVVMNVHDAAPSCAKLKAKPPVTMGWANVVVCTSQAVSPLPETVGKVPVWAVDTS